MVIAKIEKRVGLLYRSSLDFASLVPNLRVDKAIQILARTIPAAIAMTKSPNSPIQM
jgi:hypothetical protein